MNRSFFVLLPLVAALAACGGGGDSDPGPGGPSGGDPLPPVFQSSTLVTSVPAPSYAAGSEYLSAFNLLNEQRGLCGFGLLRHSTHLDTASQGHADWLLIHGFSGHYQDPELPRGFTGVTELERISAAGYAPRFEFSSGEGIAAQLGGVPAGASKDLRALFNAPYHAMNLLRGYRDIGLAARTSADVHEPRLSNQSVTVFKPAHRSTDGPQLMSSDDVMTYPCEGATGVDPTLYGETPSPVPDRNLRTQPLGSSVMIMARPGRDLVITSATMTRLSDGSAVVMRTPTTQGNDPNRLLGGNEAFVSADAAMQANTSYQAVITGSNNGKPFTRTFTFTTGTSTGTGQ